MPFVRRPESSFRSAGVRAGSDAVTTGYIWWSAALFAMVLAALAWKLGRWGRIGPAVLVVGGGPEPDGLHARTVRNACTC